MIVKLLTEHHLEFLSIKGGCTGLSVSTLIKCHIVGNNMSRLIFKLSLMDIITIYTQSLCSTGPHISDFSQGSKFGHIRNGI